MQSLGQIAYESYYRTRYGTLLLVGVCLPTWAEQHDDIKAAWEDAADAVHKQLAAENT